MADSCSSLLAFDADCHQITQQVRAKEQEAIPGHPITVAQAVIFLQYESTRPQINRKRKAADMDETAPDSSSVGVPGLKQAISALERLPGQPIPLQPHAGSSNCAPF
ncbi:hypothetical protein K438DRAFT_1749778 [Mycena galopus ATCC 62051]|nr:hypothetical protein K438DRAFT_1767270 [Mycena galopus ATCC 62051]KAF8214684.1 hypothetical protein K438DRAFT_1749778 [Mycena galopus ATCC 62051]